MTIPDQNEYIDVEAVGLWELNYNEGDVGAIARSIEEFGFNDVLQVWQGVCMAGNHSVLALRSLKRRGRRLDRRPWPPTHVIDHKGRWYVRQVPVDHLDETEATAYAVADNRTAQMATQNEALLLEHLTTIHDYDADLLMATGFSTDDLDDLTIMVEDYDHLIRSMGHLLPRDTWPYIRYQIPPEAQELLVRYMMRSKAEGDGVKIYHILSLVDEGRLAEEFTYDDGISADTIAASSTTSEPADSPEDVD